VRDGLRAKKLLKTGGEKKFKEGKDSIMGGRHDFFDNDVSVEEGGKKEKL